MTPLPLVQLLLRKLDTQAVIKSSCAAFKILHATIKTRDKWISNFFFKEEKKKKKKTQSQSSLWEALLATQFSSP